MASNLPGDICVGQHSVCLLRAALLGPDCTPRGGVDSGIVTTGIVTATASPEFIDGASFEPLNGCGGIAWAYSTRSRIRRFTLSGELTYFDHEAMSILLGGDLVVGDTGTPFAGDNIGWAAPLYTDPDPDALYLEFIVRTGAEGVGDCADPGDPFPYAVGKIFPKTTLNIGDQTMEFDAATLAFDGTSENNPNLADGPWADFPGVGGIPNSPYIEVSYSFEEYEAILETAACGFQTLPT